MILLIHTTLSGFLFKTIFQIIDVTVDQEEEEKSFVDTIRVMVM